MQGPVAQAVALVAYGNAAVRGLSRPAFSPEHSTCAFCEWVRFVDAREVRRGKRVESPVAGGPDEWLASLVEAGVSGVRLDHRPSSRGLFLDVATAGFAGGGGEWWIVCEDGGRGEGWLARWELGDRGAPDRRIWRVTYGRLGDAPAAGAGLSVADAAVALERSLESIARFSRDRAKGTFLEAFENALATLRTGEPHGYHRDLAPPGVLPAPAARLLDACQSAWVFGGMGWWNDQSFEGEARGEFDRVTQEHWTAVCAAIVAAANASGGPSRPPGAPLRKG